MTPVTPAELGKRGYDALVVKYGPKQIDKWRRMGGRKRHRTLSEIELAEARLSRSTKPGRR